MKVRPVSFLPFWAFLIFFKFAGGLHYALLSPLGEKVLPLWIVGLLIGGGAVLQLFLDVPAGHMLDRFGYRRLLKVTTAIFLCAGLCFLFGFTTLTFVLSLIISTFGWLFFGSGVNAYILSHAPKDRAGKFISLRDVFESIGIVLSSAALPFVLLFSPVLLGYVLALLFATALIMLFLSPKDVQSVHAEKKIETHHHYVKRHPLKDTIKAVRKLNPASGMLLLLDMAGSIFYGIVWFVVPLVIVHHADNGLLSAGLGIFDFAVVVLGFFLGNLADRANKRTLVFFGLLLFALSGILIGFNFTWLFLVFGFLATTGDEMASISLWSWLHSLDKDHANDGTVSGVITLFQDIGWAIGPMLAGVLYGTLGPSWAIVIGAIPLFIVWIVYQFIMRSHTQTGISIVPIKPHKHRHKR